MDRRVTPPKRATSPAWGPQLHVNRPLVKWLFWAADVKEWLFTFFTLAFKDYFEMCFAFMHTPRAPQPNPQSSLIPKNT